MSLGPASAVDVPTTLAKPVGAAAAVALTPSAAAAPGLAMMVFQMRQPMTPTATSAATITTSIHGNERTGLTCKLLDL
ncbi:hypothetical protein D3C86_1942940 [compost metagenome]